MQIRKHWQSVLGAIFVVPPLIKSIWHWVGHAGDVDFFIGHIRDLGWARDLIAWLVDPPAWSLLPMMLIGLGLIAWDARRHLLRLKEVKQPQQGHSAAAAPRPVSLAKQLEVVSAPVAALRSSQSTMRRLCSRADRMELISLIRSGDRTCVLSHWKSEREDGVRIRVDAVHLDGSLDDRFGQDGAGFTAFLLPARRRVSAQRLAPLTDASTLVIGTSFDDEKKNSVGFLLKINVSGAFDTQFGEDGILHFPRKDLLSYAQDCVQLGDHIFCVANTFDSPIIKVIKLTLMGALVDVIEVSVAVDGMAWPSRIIGTYPDNGLLIAGRIISKDSGSFDGFLVKLGANFTLDQKFGLRGIVKLSDFSTIPLVSQIIDIVFLPTGAILVAGTGNEGFVIGLDAFGKSLLNFGRSGLYEAQATYRTTATSLAYARRLGVISLAGMESDGNSINRPFVGLIDMAGRSLLPEEQDPTVISIDAHSFKMQHLLADDGRMFIAIQEGALSHGRQSILVTTMALCQPDFVA